MPYLLSKFYLKERKGMIKMMLEDTKFQNFGSIINEDLRCKKKKKKQEFLLQNKSSAEKKTAVRAIAVKRAFDLPALDRKKFLSPI